MSAISSPVVVRPTLAACAGGVLLGVVYTLSPLTVWSGLAMIVIFVWAGRGATGRERLWIFRLLGVALTLRVLALIAFFFLTYRVDGSFVALMPDDRAVVLNSGWLRNVALRIPINTRDYYATFEGGESGMTYFLAFLQLHLGTATYGIRLVNVAMYLAATVALYRTVRPTFGAPAALAGLAAVLFLPTLFVWSISALKEPGHFLLVALGLAAAAAAALRANAMPRRVRAMIACVVAVLAIETVRPDAGLLLGGGILIGVVLSTTIRRPVLLITLVAVLVMAGAYALRNPLVDNQTMNLLRRVYIPHVGFVKSGGWNYRILDPETYDRPDAYTFTMTRDFVARYFVRAVTSIVLVPLPWRAASPGAVAYLPEQVIWYVLVLLGTVGSVVGLRIDPHLTCLLLGVIVISAIALGLSEGNVGTMVRHRSIILIPLAWLSGLGATSLLKQAAKRSSGSEPLSCAVGT